MRGPTRRANLGVTEGVALMLRGKLLTLRPILASDLDHVYEAHVDIRNRGDFFPLGVVSESAFKREFAEHGFWQRERAIS